MSANKSRYYDIVTVTTVRANNMTDAKLVAGGKKISGTKVLAVSVDGERISAQEAHNWVAKLNG